MNWHSLSDPNTKYSNAAVSSQSEEEREPHSEHRASVNVTHALAGSPMEESFVQIQSFLQKRVDSLPDLQLATGPANQPSQVIIDIDLLGQQDSLTDQTLPLWQNQMTLPIRMYRSLIIVGPFYIPTQKDSPCPRCLERRWLAHRSKEEQMSIMYANQTIRLGHNPRMTPYALEALWSVIEMLWQRAWSQTSEYAGVSSFYVLNLDSLALMRSELMQDSCCPVCSSPTKDTAEAAVLHLRVRPKKSVTDYRLVKETEYNIPLQALTDSICGVLGPAPLPDFVNSLSSPVTGTFRVRSRFGVYDAWWSGHSNNYYKSLYLGLLEGIERYSGHILRGKQPAVIDSYENLAAEALDPRECGLYDTNFVRQGFPFYSPFTPTMTIPWVWGYSLRQQRPILVPEQLVYYLDARPEYPNFVQECSNGCATGSCLEEAILYGLLELIERDAFMIIWHARLAPPRIDPRSCLQKETLFALEGIERLGYELSLFDARLDINIPTVVGVAKLKKPGLGNFVLAAGAGLDPEDAIRGALCEIACYVPDFRERVGRKLVEVRHMAKDFSKVRDLTHHALLHGLPEMAPYSSFLFQNTVSRSIEETYRDWNAIRPHNLDLREDLLFCMQAIFQLGLDIIVVDQTSPEQLHTGTKTVSVIVPGLLPVDFGWGRQRIFDLPRMCTVPRTTGYSSSDFVPDVRDIVPHPFP